MKEKEPKNAEAVIKDIEMHDNTYLFDEDPDFDVPNKFHK